MTQYSWVSGPSFLPVPSALVDFGSPCGKRGVHSVGWLGVVCSNPPVLTLRLHPGADAREMLPAGDLFFVNLPIEELLQALAGRRWQGLEADLATSGWPALSTLSGEARGGALMAASPVRIECRCRSLKVRFGQHQLCGEVLAVHLDGHRHELAVPVDFCRLMHGQRRPFQGLVASCQPRDVS